MYYFVKTRNKVLTLNAVDNNQFHITKSCYMNDDGVICKRISFILFDLPPTIFTALQGFGAEEINFWIQWCLILRFKTLIMFYFNLIL